MDHFRQLIEKAAKSNLFAIHFPQAPASQQNPEYLKAYKQWVYACVKRKADAISTIELTLQRKTGDEWKETPDSTGALALLSHINDFMSSSMFFANVSSYLDLVGNAFAYVAYNERQPRELWLLDPTKVEVIKDGKKFIRGWVYTNPKGDKITLQPWEIIPFQEFNPSDPYKGMGPAEAAGLSIDTTQYAKEWNRNFFFNNAVPSLVITNESPMTQEQHDTFIQRWMARHQGRKNQGVPAVMSGKVNVHLLNNTAKDMDFKQQLETLRDEILAIFGVPKSVLGIVEDVNRANAEASEYVFSKYTIAPRMRFIATVLSEFYLPLWGLSPTEYRLWAKDCVPANDELNIKREESELMHGISTINEIRAAKGKKPVEGGDTVFVPSTMKPIDLALNPPAPLPMGGTPGQDNDKKPPAKTKAVTKDAADDRVAFIERAITEAAPKFQAIYEDQAKQLVIKMESKKGIKTADKKDIDETEHSNELVRFLFSDWSDWIGVLLNPTRETLKGSFDEAGRASLAELDTDINFDQEHARAISWLETNALAHATSIADTVKGEVSDLIIRAVKDGKGAEDIAADISGYFAAGSEWKALRIARTEVVAGYGAGSLEAYKQAGIKYKQWLTAGDSAVDGGDATGPCVVNGEQGPIPVDMPFASGADAPPNHPNCRCVLQAAVS